MFNELHKSPEILSWKFTSGTNLRHEDEDRHLQIIKKLYDYTKDEFKRLEKVQALRGKRKEKFEKETEICLFEFFYWYRIKANYRDLEYLDSDIGVNEFYEYYSAYYGTIINVFSALVEEINRLSQIRFGKPLF